MGRRYRYPSVWDYDSKDDYELACINYCPQAVQGHYDKQKDEAIDTLHKFDDQAMWLASSFDFFCSIEDDLRKHIDAIEKILNTAEPIKCIEL